ncbi:MAG: hypothetical protein ACR2JY_16090 [Chloroflexota bacterium]
MRNVDSTVEIAVTKLEARILFDRILLEPNDDFSLRIRNLLRVALREEPDDRHSQTSSLPLTKRQCYRILNSIRDSFTNEVSRSLADKVMDALLDLETKASVDEFLGGTIAVAVDARFDRRFTEMQRDLQNRDGAS